MVDKGVNILIVSVVTNKHNWLHAFGTRIKVTNLICLKQATVVSVLSINTIQTRFVLWTSIVMWARVTVWTLKSRILLDLLKYGVHSIIHLGLEYSSHHLHLCVQKPRTITILVLVLLLLCGG